MTLERQVAVDVDQLVADMLEIGPGEVPCPRGMPSSDYKEIQAIIGDVVAMYHPIERSVPWQPNPLPSSGVTLMDHIKNRDYDAARELLVLCGDPVLA